MLNSPLRYRLKQVTETVQKSIVQSNKTTDTISKTEYMQGWSNQWQIAECNDTTTDPKALSRTVHCCPFFFTTGLYASLSWPQGLFFLPLPNWVRTLSVKRCFIYKVCLLQTGLMAAVCPLRVQGLHEGHVGLHPMPVLHLHFCFSITYPLKSVSFQNCKQ